MKRRNIPGENNHLVPSFLLAKEGRKEGHNITIQRFCLCFIFTFLLHCGTEQRFKERKRKMGRVESRRKQEPFLHSKRDERALFCILRAGDCLDDGPYLLA